MDSETLLWGCTGVSLARSTGVSEWPAKGNVAAPFGCPLYIVYSAYEVQEDCMAAVNARFCVAAVLLARAGSTSRPAHSFRPSTVMYEAPCFTGGNLLLWRASASLTMSASCSQRRTSGSDRHHIRE